MLNSLLVKSIIKKDIESGEITVDTSKKMDKENPSGTGSFSMNRKADTEVGANSTTEGTENVASGENSHAEGKTSTASGHASHSEGWNSKASGAQAHAEGSSTASGKNSHSEGTATKATSEASHAEGYYTIAGGGSAHAEGNNSSAIGNSSHAEGYYAHADGASSHSEGQYTYSEGTASHSEGEYSKAQGIDSHAEGNRTTALGNTSHSEGSSTNNANTSRINSGTSNDDVITYWETSKFSLAKGTASHVEGKDCLALGDYSHSGGLATRAGYQSQTAIGEYNENKEEDIFEVGNGTSDARSNALELTKTGDLKICGSYIDGSGNAISMDSANEYTDQKIADLINGAPTTLDTLKEIADAMEENQDVVKTLDESIGKKANASDLTDHASNTNNPHNVTAEQMPYDNTESKLSAQNVQDAVDEVNINFNNIEIGGRNLYLGTKDFSGNWYKDSLWTTYSETYKGFTVKKRIGDFNGLYQIIQADVGDVLTFSGYVKRDASGQMYVFAIDDSDKEHGTAYPNNKTFTVEANTWTRVSFTFKVTVSGKFAFRFENPEKRIATYVCGLKLERGNKATDWTPAPEDIENEIDEKVGQNGCGEIAGGKNLFNKNTVLIGYGLNAMTGNAGQDANFNCSDYIKVEPNTTYTRSESGSTTTIVYDSSKKYISELGNNLTFTIPPNGAYVRFNIAGDYINNYSDIQIEKGSTATPYEPYYPSNKMLDEHKADKSEVTTNLLKPTFHTETQYGVTCTNNGDGTYTVNGTATDQCTFRIYSNVGHVGMRVIGCPRNGSSSTYSILLSYSNEFGQWQTEEYDIGNGKIIKDHPIVDLDILIRKNTVCDNIVFKPMLTTNLNATYDDFVPFTGTTGKLNGDVAELEKSNEGKMDKANPTGTGAFSMNRKADTTVGDYSTTEGSNCEASAICSHAEGSDTIAKESCSHAEGHSTTASGFYSHAEGYKTTASNTSSHSEGYRTTSSGDYGSHAEGNITTAKGNSSHAEGFETTASGSNSHSEGYNTKAEGDYSHSGGYRTIAGYSSQTAIGKYNENKEEDIFEVGNGTSDTSRSNALELTKTGDLKIAGGLLDTVLSMIVDHIYEGVDLTVKFASEIANYSDEWAWIKSRVTDGNYSGIHVGDYIPITCSNGYVLNAQVAGINAYTGSEYMDEYTGNIIKIGNHIDFICKELWNNFHVMNKVAYNNGNGNNLNPFLASDLNYWLNSMSGTVPNSSSDPSVTTSVDYTAGGVLYYLPDKLKNQIIEKSVVLPIRYSSGSVVTSDNECLPIKTGKLWIPSEVEIYGKSIFGCARYSCGFVQYPLFANNMNVKRLCAGGGIANWWLLSSVDGYSTQFVVFNRDICGLSYLNANNSYAAAPVCFRI